MLIFCWLAGLGNAVLFSFWCSGGQGVIAECDLLPLKRGINYLGGSTLLAQPNTTQNQKAVKGKEQDHPAPDFLSELWRVVTLRAMMWEKCRPQSISLPAREGCLPRDGIWSKGKVLVGAKAKIFVKLYILRVILNRYVMQNCTK